MQEEVQVVRLCGVRGALRGCLHCSPPFANGGGGRNHVRNAAHRTQRIFADVVVIGT